jgi:Helix-turn-helix domain
MSVDALSWAKKQRTGAPAPKCVLMTLADYADEDGVCWPSQETLAKVTEQSVDSVQRQLRQLEEIHLIERRGRGLRNGRRAVTVYTLMMNATTVGLKGTTPQIAAPQIAAPQSTAPQNRVNDTAPVRHEPSIEPSIDAAADAGAREPSKSLITPEAFALSSDLMRLQRLEKDDPRSIGQAYAVQAWLTKGWDASVIRATVDIVMSRRADAPKALRYFETAITEAHVERDRPLPVITHDAGIGTIHNRGSKHASYRNGGGFALNALEFARRAAGQPDCPDHS